MRESRLSSSATRVRERVRARASSMLEALRSLAPRKELRNRTAQWFSSIPVAAQFMFNTRIRLLRHFLRVWSLATRRDGLSRSFTLFFRRSA
jgi:hypothetical protein